MSRLLASAAAVALLSGTAVAADLPLPMEPIEDVVAAPAFSWTGIYVGVNAGFQWSVDGDVSNTGTDTGGGGLGTILAAGLVPASANLDDAGIIGGAQVGYNWQRGGLVLGLEADIQALDHDRSASFTHPGGGGFVPFTTAFEREIDWLGTVRARVGAAFFERALIYATGGLAYGETVITNRFICPTCVPPAAITSSSSDVSFGWTAGAGGEYALTDHLSLKAEALYYDLGDRSTTLTYNYVPANTSTLTSSAEFTGVIARGGINWRF